MTEQRHKEAIKRLVEHTGNNECAECLAPDPSYASVSLGIFLCPVCAKLHQKCIKNISEVFPIVNHVWTKEEVDFMYTEGNKIVNAKYEKYLPIYYHRPRPNDPEILFEQWILAKYDREEFMEQSQQSAYAQGSKTGALFKRMKDQEKFQRRKFILNVNEGKLLYFIKYSDKNPKDSILIRNLVNVYIVPEKLGNENGMQITYEKDGVRRNLYVFGENGKSTTDWYHAIRAAMARLKYKDFNQADVKKYLNTTIIMEGWMTKTGPKKHEKFRRRWFSLVGTAIWYYGQPLDAHPLGYIPLGSKTFGYAVMRGFPKGIREEGHGLTVHTPERVYVLNCMNQNSRDQWSESIEQVLTTCTSVWKKPSVMTKKQEPEKVLNLDDIDDLDKPSRTSVFTDMPSANGGGDVRGDKIINLDDIDDLETPTTEYVSPDSMSNASGTSTDGPKQRTPLFVKNVKSGQRKDGNIGSKVSVDKKARHGGTVKISDKNRPTDFEDKNDISSDNADDARAFRPSKKYSDDSETSGSEVETVATVTVSSRVHPRTNQLISDADSEKGGMVSSATDEDSEEEVVVLRKKKEPLDQLRNRTSSGASANNRHSFPRLSPRSQSPKPSLSPLARPRSTFDGISPIRSMPPKKPPRRKFTSKESDTTSTSSDFDSDSKPSEFELLHLQNCHMSQESLSKSLNAVFLEPKSDDPPEKSDVQPEENQAATNLLSPQDSVCDWRMNTFTTSVRRVEGKERKSLKADSKILNAATVDPIDETSKDAPPRPLDVSIYNKTENKIWFMLFQCEEDKEHEESYTTPWLGAEIAEMPASVGPIRLPSEFEIAVIDTAPGGYGLRRTTGPFYAEPGDVWEVDMPVDDGSAPDMFYHEGMEAEDGSVVVHSNLENSKNFEVALFKSGRKLFSRKNIKPGESAAFKVNPSLYVMHVNQDLFYEMENDDIRTCDVIPKSSEVKLDFRMPKLKLSARERADMIYFSSQTMYSFKKYEPEDDECTEL